MHVILLFNPGTITLKEMVRVVFPNASKSDYRMMDCWIDDEDQEDERKKSRREKRIKAARLKVINPQQQAELEEVFRV
jgi:hypothetical protein